MFRLDDRSSVVNEGHTRDKSWDNIDGKVTLMIDHTEDIHYVNFVTNDTWTTTNCIDIYAVITSFATSAMLTASTITIREHRFFSVYLLKNQRARPRQLGDKGKNVNYL